MQTGAGITGENRSSRRAFTRILINDKGVHKMDGVVFSILEKSCPQRQSSRSETVPSATKAI